MEDYQYYKAISKGREGFVFIDKFGTNVDVTGEEDIWNGGGLYTGFPQEAETLEIFSSSVNDTAAGTGARTVTIDRLLDENYNIAPPVTVTLNGTTPVSLGSKLYRRATRVTVITAGSNNRADGQFTLRHSTTTANIFAIVPANRFNKSTIAAYTVPAGYDMYLLRTFARQIRAAAQAGSATVSFNIKPVDSNVFRPIFIEAISTSASYMYNKIIPRLIEEKTDIVWRCNDVSNASIITAGFTGYLEKFGQYR